MTDVIDILLLAFLVVSAAAAIRQRGLLSAVMLLSIYSLVMCAVWVRLDAVDVAFTETAVGAGISTILLLAVLGKTGSTEKAQPWKSKVFPLIMVLVVAAGLVYGTLDMPPLGDINNVVNQHVVPRYIEGSLEEAGVPNFVAAILAYYRGYDTLFETTVIFTAVLCVLMLLRGEKGTKKKGEPLTTSGGVQCAQSEENASLEDAKSL